MAAFEIRKQQKVVLTSVGIPWRVTITSVMSCMR